MRAPFPGNEAAYTHYLTMLHWHNDGKRVGTLISALFFIVAGFDFVMFLATGSEVFAFFACFGAVVSLAGVFLAHHHGKKITKWQKRLDRITIHHIPVITMDKINVDALDTSLFTVDGHLFPKDRGL